MFRTLDCAPFGQLKSQGLSPNWTGKISLPSFDGAFHLVVHGSKDGPIPAQIAAMETMLADISAIKERAAAPMLDLHIRSGLLPREADSTRLWSALKPESIEVTDETYYRDGRIAIMIIFESQLAEPFLPAIETANGHFVDVLSGT